ncbi:Exopolyphosphatase [Nitrospira sp. KM1]|uniref:Ppx/GppA phosphatase family protein n=1 Tax=Nitrospira sp. KM1 TaxID=1936990 RepID=UPI0013A7453E|nr:Ppx/GppA phosphatase family protein [Nitrospira sp. KM1]BCA56856.1 Exopolyphosphatase [Nitrospira sp. KM1]
MSAKRLAGVDIGTLTCRLLIADVPERGPLNELHSERRILRLGEGVDGTGGLAEPAMERVIRCLIDWRRVIEDYRVSGMTAVATSAVRDANNRFEFLERIRREAGFSVEILSGEEEAHRTMLGIRAGLPEGRDDVLAIDIGGGSTEFIRARKDGSLHARSVDIGVVRLCERMLRHDPPTDEEVRSARRWIRESVLNALSNFPSQGCRGFVGTAGTITSLAAMAQGLSRYEPARIHNYRLTLDAIVGLETKLLALSSANRAGLPGLEKGREEVIAAGAIIIRTIMETLGETICLVSDAGLREGVIIHLGMQPTGMEM